MDNFEIAKMKIERATKTIEDFEELSPDELRSVIWCMNSALEVLPKQSKEKLELYYYLQSVASLNIKKYGTIFKGVSETNSVLIKKQDMIEIAWRINSLMF